MPTSKASELFRHNVATVMADRGISHGDLATGIGTKRPAISKILAGREGVTLDRAERIAKFLGFPLSALVGDKIEQHA